MSTNRSRTAYALLVQRRHLVWHWVVQDLQRRFGGSMLGFSWVALQPLALMAIYTIVFTFVFQVRLTPAGGALEYAAYAMAGIIPWLTVQDALVRSAGSVIGSPSLVKQVVFPVDVLPVAAVTGAFLTQAVNLAFYFVLVLASNADRARRTWLLLPVAAVILWMFCLGVGWFLAAAAVALRDIQDILVLLLNIALYASPVLYVESMVPPSVAWLLRLNPITPFLYMYRDILFYGHLLHPGSLLASAALAVASAAFGYRFFRWARSFFPAAL